MNVDTTETPIKAYMYVMRPDRVPDCIAPVGHEFYQNLYRVPVHIENERHTVFVGDNHKRMFDADTLPDFMKHKLAMIKVTDSKLKDDMTLSVLELFTMPKDRNRRFIGWRASQSMYIVVMTANELQSLKG